MNRFAPYDYDYSVTPGSRFTRFTLTDRAGTPTRFGVVICYEDTDPPLARRYAAPGDDQVDFLVNLSNDGWFDGSSEHAQHLAISRFRAVECRRALVRAVNMGISAVIDADGRIVALPRPVGDDEGLAAEATTWSAATKVSGVVDATVPIDRRMSLYARFGDWLPWACWLVFMVGAWRGVGLGR
jgi:apolipoprotein N-acyltransferase